MVLLIRCCCFCFKGNWLYQSKNTCNFSNWIMDDAIYLYSHFTCLLLCSYQRYDTSRVSTQLPGQSRFAKLIISYTLAKTYMINTPLRHWSLEEFQRMSFKRNDHFDSAPALYQKILEITWITISTWITSKWSLIQWADNYGADQVSEDEFGGMINAAAALPKKFGFDWWQVGCTYHRLCCLKS